MNTEYRPALLAVSRRLQALGYHVVEDSSHMALLDNGSCWRICVEGERYSNSTSLHLRYVSAGPETQDEFAVWLLMEAFEKIFKMPHVVPRLDAQLDFLYDRLSAGFPEPMVFRAEYDRLNQYP